MNCFWALPAKTSHEPEIRNRAVFLGASNAKNTFYTTLIQQKSTPSRNLLLVFFEGTPFKFTACPPAPASLPNPTTSPLPVNKPVATPFILSL